MKIVKIPITEQNKKVYWSKNKNSNAWEKLVSECPSMTSEEFWNNELKNTKRGSHTTEMSQTIKKIFI